MSVDWVNKLRAPDALSTWMRGVLAASALLAAAWPGVAAAQDASAVSYREGLHYETLGKPLSRTDAAAGEVEVVGFFWYGCSHCYRFEPLLQSWVRKLPDDVRFQASPVGFGHPIRKLHARAFYVIQALGQMDPLHDRVFHAMHAERQTLNSEGALAQLFAQNGVGEQRFRSAMHSFGVGAMLSQAESRAKRYGVTGTPQMGVNGKYLVASTRENKLTPPDILKVVSYLVAKERREATQSATGAKRKQGAEGQGRQGQGLDQGPLTRS